MAESYARRLSVRRCRCSRPRLHGSRRSVQRSVEGVVVDAVDDRLADRAEAAYSAIGDEVMA